jgi:hypothetical protein
VPAYNPKESIEGEKISGDSRDPLRFQRVQKINGRKLYIFKAEFNVHAQIAGVLPSGTAKIDENALTQLGEKLSSDTAVIASLSKNFSSVLESNFTATHSGNTWEFPKQTNAKVITPRQQIINAMRKRLIGEQQHAITDTASSPPVHTSSER